MNKITYKGVIRGWEDRGGGEGYVESGTGPFDPNGTIPDHPCPSNPQTGEVEKSPFESAAKRLVIDHMCQ